MNPLVSIIIPIYNSESYLKETIESAISQTWLNKEIILVDDGSKDQSLQLAKSFENDWIKVFHQENKGASAARNLGLANAKGDYIQFLDGDDLLSANKVEAQLKALNGSLDQIAVCSTVHFFDGEDFEKLSPSDYEEKFLLSTDHTDHFLINLWGGNTGEGSMISVNTWLTPKKLIDIAGKWNEELSLDDDGEFFARVILNAKGIIKTNGFGYYRKVQGGTLSSTKNYKGVKSLLYSTLSKKTELFKRNDSDAAKRAIDRLLTDVALFSYPQFPDLLKTAEENYSNLNRKTPALGGWLINLIAELFGWKFARKLQNLKS